MIRQSVGQTGQDRTEPQSDQISIDMVAAIVPGVSGDSPNNDFSGCSMETIEGIGEQSCRPQDRPSADEQDRAPASGLHPWDME